MPSLLFGVRVLDLSRVLAGPRAAMTLPDLGADVVKVEPPGAGDDTRGWGPPFAADGASAYYLCANRGKRGLALDLKQAGGLALLRELVAASDVVIENFRAGTLEALGLSFDELARLRPGIVYCTITGFGYGHPHSREAGYDFMIQARAGVMSVTGAQGGEPTKVGVAVCDLFAGMNAATAILAALFARERARANREELVAQRVDIALFDSAVAMLANQASDYLLSGVAPGRLGNAHPHIVPYQAFRAADGSFALAVGNDEQWRRLVSALGDPAWALEARFATNAGRVEHRAELLAPLSRALREHTTAHWIAACDEIGVPASPIQDLAQVFADPRAAERRLRETLRTAAGQEHAFVRSALRVPTSPEGPRRAPPALGEHTAEVLREWIGLEEARIGALREQGVVQ